MHCNYATCRKPSGRRGWYMLADVGSHYHAYFPRRRMQYAHCNLTQIGFPPAVLKTASNLGRLLVHYLESGNK